MLRLLPILLLFGGCIETGLFGGTNTDQPGDTDGDGAWKGDVDTWPPINGEYCNGLDDDGDGLIDEGFPDLDQDGIADCVDEDCDVQESDGGELGFEGDCTANRGEPPYQPWSIDRGWQWTGLTWAPDVRNVITPPMVGRVTDDNGDGVVDENDPPDVAFVAFDNELANGHLVLLDGATGELHWAVPDVLATGGTAIADVDGDRQPDLIVFNPDRKAMAYDRLGTRLWRAMEGSETEFPQVTVADLDGDGITDVIADNLRLRGTDGQFLNRYIVSTGTIGYRMPAVGDINLDGSQEVVLANGIYQANGAPIHIERGLVGAFGHWSAILEADGDLTGEVAMIAAGRLVILDHKGVRLVDVPSGNDHPGAPCVADFDGDGEAEIGWASNNRFVVHDLDGTEVWSRRVLDATGLLATCSGFDFDGDGSCEILYSDNETVYLFDGKTGAVLYQNAGHSSTTIWEYPTVADIDGDGSAEILVASNRLNNFGGWAGVTVLEHRYGAWMPASATWHVHDFAVTNINEDGTVPPSPEPSWQRYNVYRARPAEDRLSVDLQASISDVCFAGCTDDAAVSIAVQVWNAGNDNSAAGIPIALYAVTGELQELIGVRVMPKRVPAGYVSDTVVFETTVGRLGEDGFLVRVDDDGAGGQVHPDECDETNNVAVSTDLPCGR